MAATHVLGFSAEAKSAFQRAYSLLRDVPQHPMRRCLLHGFGFVLSLRADDAEALAVAERAEALSSTTNDPDPMLAACIVHGEVDQLQGRSRVALTWIARDLDAGQHQLEEALQFANTHGERVYLPQLFLIEAAIARARGQSAIAAASVRRAIAEARGQEARWLELLALNELCDHDGATPEDRRALAALVDELPEANDTTAVARARAWSTTRNRPERKGEPTESHRMQTFRRRLCMR